MMLNEKYVNFLTTEEFILDREFSLWVMNPDKELDELWNSFIKEHPEKQTFIKDAVFIIKAFQPIEKDIPQQRLKRLIWLPDFAQIAAVLIIAVLFSALYNLFLVTKPSEKNDAIVYQQVKASYGTQSRIGLADGTIVYLNSGSTLRFPNSFSGAKTRNVELTGEGHFEVAKNNEQPFIVDIHKIQIKVLGTTFNVDAYANNSSFTIALVEGIIEIQQKTSNGITDLMQMKPNQVAFYNQSENTLKRKTESDLNKYTAWTDGKIILSNDPVNTVIDKLENWYNVDIELADKRLEKYRFTGTFIDEPLEQVLSILNLTSHMQYKVIPAQKLGDNSYSKRKIILKSR